MSQDASVTLLLGGEERTLKYTLKAWARLQKLCPNGDLSVLDTLSPFELLPLIIQAGLDPKTLPAGFDSDVLDEWISEAEAPEKLALCLDAWKSSAGFIQALFAGAGQMAEAVDPASKRKGE